MALKGLNQIMKCTMEYLSDQVIQAAHADIMCPNTITLRKIFNYENLFGVKSNYKTDLSNTTSHLIVLLV